MRSFMRKERDKMAYQEYFVKVGEYIIPLKFMNSGTYKGYRSVLDLDTYTDANGQLHRDTLDHVPCKAEFETPPMMTDTEYDELMGNIEKNFIDELERKANVTIYIPEKRTYITQEMYMPDVTPTVHSVLNGEVRYDSIRLAFIGY